MRCCTMSVTRWLGTSCAASMYVLASKPSLLPAATSARSRSPVLTCVMPNLFTQLALCPLAGGGGTNQDDLICGVRLQLFHQKWNGILGLLLDQILQQIAEHG
mmetsp:Transcript_15035/g.32656  ORF Transcript_15035/g.32656 Transcript_15035/m.32656 type:complete len:103 (+) Transcript_15035:515-823(+)